MLRIRNPVTKEIIELILAPDDLKLVRDHYNLGRYEAMDKLLFRTAKVFEAAEKGPEALAILKPSAVDSIVCPLLLEQNAVSDKAQEALNAYVNRNYESHKQTNARLVEDVKIYDAVLTVIDDPATTPDTLHRWVVTALYPQTLENLQKLAKIAGTVANPPSRIKGGVYWQNLVRRYKKYDQGQKEAALEVIEVALALKSGKMSL